MMQGFNNFPAIRRQLETQGGSVVRKAAFDIEGNAKNFAPVDTGNLKASIGARELRALLWMVATAVHYGVHQEYGTRYQSGTAFMRPAVERVRPGYVAAWKQFLSGLGKGLGIR